MKHGFINNPEIIASWQVEQGDLIRVTMPEDEGVIESAMFIVDRIVDADRYRKFYSDERFVFGLKYGSAPNGLCIQRFPRKIESKPEALFTMGHPVVKARIRG